MEFDLTASISHFSHVVLHIVSTSPLSPSGPRHVSIRSDGTALPQLLEIDIEHGFLHCTCSEWLSEEVMAVLQCACSFALSSCHLGAPFRWMFNKQRLTIAPWKQITKTYFRVRAGELVLTYSVPHGTGRGRPLSIKLTREESGEKVRDKQVKSAAASSDRFVAGVWCLVSSMIEHRRVVRTVVVPTNDADGSIVAYIMPNQIISDDVAVVPVFCAEDDVSCTRLPFLPPPYTAHRQQELCCVPSMLYGGQTSPQHTEVTRLDSTLLLRVSRHQPYAAAPGQLYHSSPSES